MGQDAVAAGAMKFEVSHRTTYTYRAPVAQSHHLVHLKPRPTQTQSVIHHSLLIEPAPVSLTEITDVFGNSASLLRIEDEHTEFIVHARSTVATTPQPPPVLDQGTAWEAIARLADRHGEAIDIDVRQFVCRSRHAAVSHEIRKFALLSFPPERPVLAGAMHLTRRIFEEFVFDPKATDVSTPVGARAGDQAWGLPRFRAPCHRCVALHRRAGALRQWLPDDPSAARAGEAEGRRCVPRVVVRLVT